VVRTRVPPAPDCHAQKLTAGGFAAACLESQPSMSPNVTSRPVTPADLPAIAHLHATVFGPGRFTRTAYRIREGTPDISSYCRAALLGERLIAAVRLTRVTVGGTGGALLLGPLAVDPEFAGQGYGKRLVAEAIDAARADGVRIILLVGDEPYYGRFGFRPVPPGQISLPGPVDQRRLLAAELVPGALPEMRGMIAAERC